MNLKHWQLQPAGTNQGEGHFILLYWPCLIELIEQFLILLFTWSLCPIQDRGNALLELKVPIYAARAAAVCSPPTYLQIGAGVCPIPLAGKRGGKNPPDDDDRS